MSTPDPLTTYLAALESPWPREAASAVVDAIRSAGPFDEAIKWGHPYFAVNDRAVVKIFTARDWINVFFYRGVELTDTAMLLEPDERARMRKTRILRGQPLPQCFAALVAEARNLELP
ncbi:DUF1801 domain-containing protein [Streptomyces sp. NPDC047022]|uniref:DUF1801 domain-containing protein n=1 Tax=Streptomyces sp. NPDC047022 TaxID=3155737 RepID=UPI0033FB0DC8